MEDERRCEHCQQPIEDDAGEFHCARCGAKCCTKCFHTRGDEIRCPACDGSLAQEKAVATVGKTTYVDRCCTWCNKKLEALEAYCECTTCPSVFCATKGCVGVAITTSPLPCRICGNATLARHGSQSYAIVHCPACDGSMTRRVSDYACTNCGHTDGL